MFNFLSANPLKSKGRLNKEFEEETSRTPFGSPSVSRRISGSGAAGAPALPAAFEAGAGAPAALPALEPAAGAGLAA